MNRIAREWKEMEHESPFILVISQRFVAHSRLKSDRATGRTFQLIMQIGNFSCIEGKKGNFSIVKKISIKWTSSKFLLHFPIFL